MRRRWYRSLVLLAAALAVGLAAGGATAHHGAQADCRGLAQECSPSGVVSFPLTNTNPTACRFDATVSWGDGTSSSFPDFANGTRATHQLPHGVFTVVLSGSGTPRNPGDGPCTFTGASRSFEVPSPPAPPPQPSPSPPAAPAPGLPASGDSARPVGRITDIGPDTVVLVRGRNGETRSAREGDRLFVGDDIVAIGGPGAEFTADLPDQELTFEPAVGEGGDASGVNQCVNQAVSGGAEGEPFMEGEIQQYNGEPVYSNSCGQVILQSTESSEEQQLHGVPGRSGSFALTPEATTQIRGRARIVRDPRRRRTTVTNLRGAVHVRPSNPGLRALRLAPGQEVDVTSSAVGRPGALDLANSIPFPRDLRVGPTLVTAPSRLSLRSLRTSKCVRVVAESRRAARVLLTIFSGRRSVRLFGQKLVRFSAPGRKVTCIRVPRRARTFNVRTPLSFAVGYALGLRSRPGQRSPRPVIRPIRLSP